MNKHFKEENHITTAEKVKQMKGWENLSDEMAENIARTVRRMTELFYITIAREQNLNPLPGSENETKNLAPKKRTQKRKART